MISISGYNVPEVFVEMLTRMRHYLVAEDSRNGPVRTFQVPVSLTIHNPMQRVLTDSTRDANPFFHMAEFCWMMAGSNDIQWIARFNKRMLEYSDDGYSQYAAYGHRWRKAFSLDQIKKAITMLRKDPNDRRVVISMWDPDMDLGHKGRDIPCNTHLYLRVVDGKLNMTVCNRSNDIIWGMLGANAVHMTMLHELIAQATGTQVGYYTVVSNNAHIYDSVPNFDYYMKGIIEEADIYFRSNNRAVTHVPLLQSNETYADFVTDCENLLRLGSGEKPTSPIRTFWMKHVGAPAMRTWFGRKAGLPIENDLNEIVADDWRIACEEWIERRRNAAVGNQRPDYNTRLAGGEQVHNGLASGTDQPMPVADVDNSQPDVGAATPESGPIGNVSP